MLTPHELVAKAVAPYLRALVAQTLAERGMGQERIARLLGVSQAMVNRYLRWESKPLERLREAGVDPGEARAVAEALAAKLARDDRTGYMALMTSFLNALLARGSLCRLHQALGAPSNCSICLNLFQAPRDPLAEEVLEAAKLLASTAGAGELLPRVGSNIVAAAPGASTMAEVVGLTGGIFPHGDAAAIVGAPVYGGSRHTASVLLAAMRAGSKARAAVVAAYKPECIEGAKRLRLKIVYTGPHSSPDAIPGDVEEAVRSLRGEADAIVSLGGPGLEPVIYFLGHSPIDVVEKMLKSCRQRVA